jgi:ABC-type Fe3+ transport system substrate-binding protein
VGVTRHARNPEAAIALIDWMLQRDVQIRHAARTSAFPVLPEAEGNHNIVAVASGESEAAKLAERARYR